MLSGFAKLDKTTGFALLLIIGGALALRLFFYNGLMETIYGHHLLTDEQLYHIWAKAIAEGRPGAYFLYDQAPLPAYFVALLYTLFSPDPFLFRIANIISGLLTCYFLYLVGAALGGKKTGLISCVLSALYAPYILYNIVPLKTAMAICLLAGSMALLSSLSSGAGNLEKLVKLFGIGLLLGLLSLVRSNSLILVFMLLPLPLILYKKGNRLGHGSLGLAVCVLGLFLAFAPFWYIGHADPEHRSHSSQLGRNLYYGNGPDNPTPYFHPMPFASSVPGESSIQFIVEASRRQGRDLTAAEASSFWVKEVLHYCIDSPVAFLSHLGVKLKAIVSSFEAGDHYNIDYLATLSPRFGLPLPGFALIFSLGIGGAVLAFRSSALSRFLLIPFTLYSFSLLLFYVSGRYRIPLTVFLIPWAAVGISHLIVSVSERKWAKVILYVVVCSIAFYVTQLPYRGRDDFSQYYNVHAALLNKDKRFEEAIQYWEKSVEFDGTFSPLARLYLSGKYYERNRRDEALSLLNNIGDDSYVAYSKYALLGDIFMHEGKKEEAIAAYLASLGKNGGQRRIRKSLIRLYFDNPETRDKALEQAAQFKWVDNFFRK